MHVVGAGKDGEWGWAGRWAGEVVGHGRGWHQGRAEQLWKGGGRVRRSSEEEEGEGAWAGRAQAVGRGGVQAGAPLSLIKHRAFSIALTGAWLPTCLPVYTSLSCEFPLLSMTPNIIYTGVQRPAVTCPGLPCPHACSTATTCRQKTSCSSVDG